MRFSRKLLGEIKSGFGFSLGIGLGFFLLVVSGLVAQTMYTFTAGDVISASTINHNFDQLKAKTDEFNGVVYQNGASLNHLIAPIGGIVAWHKDFNNVPTLPEGWQECDGNVITDADSPLVGETLPNLNGEARFLRGSSTSGTAQDDMFQDHGHYRNPSSRDELFLYNDGPVFATLYTGSNASGRQTGTNSETGIPSSGRHGSETRPINMSVVWVMRIK